MKKALIVAAATLAFGVSACDVDQTEEGSLPDVDVEGGNMPEFDVEAPDVDITTGEETVTVPTLDVDVTSEDAAGEPVTGDE